MLHLDRSVAGYITGDDKGEVFERVERVANYTLGLVFPYEQNFTQVG